MPIVLVDREFWKPMYAWLSKTLIATGKISPSDVELFRILDEPQEVVNHIKEKLWI